MRLPVLVAPLLLLAVAAAQTPAGPPQAETMARVDPNPTLVLKQFLPGQPLRLIAYGDMRFTDPTVTKGTNPRVRQWLAEKIGAERPQALLITGDMPFVGDRKADWAEYQKETASWRAAGFPVLPTLGNHEIYYNRSQGIQNYLDNYPLIQRHRYYSALLGQVEVLSLDMTEGVSPRSPQGRWFEAQLDHVPPQVEFLMILYHLPWIADTQTQMFVGLPGKDALTLRDTLEAHLTRLRAKVIVFSGHIHNYERFERHGVEYVITGGGGAVPYPIYFRGSHDLYRDTGFPVYHYLTLAIDDHRLHAEMWKVIDPDANTLEVERKDSFDIQANRAVKTGKRAAAGTGNAGSGQARAGQAESGKP